MGAIGVVARSVVRRTRGTLVLLALTVALVSGAVLTAATGAHRTSTVVDRYLDDHPEPEATLGVSRPLVASDAAAVQAMAADVVRVSGADEVVPYQSIFVVDYDLFESYEGFEISTSTDDRFLASLPVEVREGRVPAGDGRNEIAVDERTAEVLGLGVGDHYVIRTMQPGTLQAMFDGAPPDSLPVDGPALDVEVVGIYRSGLAPEGSVLGAIGSNDLGAAVGRAGAGDVSFSLRGDPDVIAVDAAVGALNEAAPQAWVYASVREERLEPLRRSVDIIAAGLVIFSVVALGAGLLALGQIVGRQVVQASAAGRATRALGMRRRSITLALALPSIWAAAVGVGVGILIAVFASRWFPTSIARDAEVDPGVRIDVPVLLAGAVLVVAAVSTWAIGAAWVRMRMRPGDRGQARSSRGSGLRRALPPAAGVGCGSVLAAGRGRDVARPRSAMIGAVLGVGGVVAIFVFTVSQTATSDDPVRLGWGWDALPLAFGSVEESELAPLVDDPRTTAVAKVACDHAVLETMATADDGTSMCAMDVIAGSMSLTYLDGRPPSSPDEVAVGRVTLADHDLSLGDVVDLTGDSGTSRSMRIVGVPVQPDSVAPGTGVVVDPAAYAALADAEDFTYVPVSFAPGVERTEMIGILEDFGLGVDRSTFVQQPVSLSQLAEVRPTLLALGAFLAVLGGVGLLHFLMLSGGRRSHESAVLRALGFVRRQTVTVTITQAVTIAAIGVLVGVPVGIVVGRTVWRETVDQVGIVDDPTTPWLVTGLVVVGAVVGACAASLLPAWLASRRDPAAALRDE